MSKDQEAEDDNQETYESDCEDLEDYKKEGYHPVYLKEQLLNGRYVILQKLGWGHFSTVWLAEDKEYGNTGVEHSEKFVALKIQKSKESYSEAAADEIQILKALRESKENEAWVEARNDLKGKGLNLDKDDTFVIELLNNFVHFGMHGKHYCSTFHIMGPNLLEIIRFFEKEYGTGIPISLVKKITIQLLIGLDFMHRMGGVIHTDLKPENVMIDLSKELIHEVVEQLKFVKMLPLSMKYLKALQSNTGVSKNKKKKKKKKIAERDSTAAKSEPVGNSGSVSCNSPEHKSEPEPKNTQIGEAVSGQDQLKQEFALADANFLKEGKEEPTLANSAMKEEKMKREDENMNKLEPDQQNGNQVPQPSTDLKKEDNDPKPSPHQSTAPNEVCNSSQIKNELEGQQDKVNQSPVEISSGSNQTKPKEESSKGHPQSSSVEIMEEKPWEESKSNTVIEGEFSKEESMEEAREGEIEYHNEEEFDGHENVNCFGENKEYTYYWKEKVKVLLNENLKIKLVDLGNACWIKKHFTDNIQTREYRSPEAILGSRYEANTDMWSLACMVFELLTGDYLFRPESDRAEPRDELHLALFISTLGKMPKKIALEGKYSREVFNKSGKLLHASVPEDYPIDQIMSSEYRFSQKEAAEIRDFLLPMLEYDVDKRISAREALNHPWLWSK